MRVGARPEPRRWRTCARSGCRGTSTWGSSSGWKTKSRRGGTRAGREQTRRWRGACSGFSSSASCRACRTGNARSASWRSGARCSKNTRRMVAPRETLRRGNEASTTRARHRAEAIPWKSSRLVRGAARGDRPGSTCARTRRRRITTTAGSSSTAPRITKPAGTTASGRRWSSRPRCTAPWRSGSSADARTCRRDTPTCSPRETARL